MSKPLSQALPGEHVRITSISKTQKATRQRLLDMGVTRGAKILVRRVAPLGDPIEIELKGYHLAIRKSEASMIEVEQDS
jgi:Fe2+ transport system protein FeoA